MGMSPTPTSLIVHLLPQAPPPGGEGQAGLGSWPPGQVGRLRRALLGLQFLRACQCPSRHGQCCPWGGSSQHYENLPRSHWGSSFGCKARNVAPASQPEVGDWVAGLLTLPALGLARWGGETGGVGRG